ncbi:hypothetical protein ACFUIT_32725 [Streptomyces sp. NPDC057239]|uniref:hypothetical protein n=1 Tax=Streptomyces sp. NPDC057239 TaxID=3346061 RepID=UPI003640DCF7
MSQSELFHALTQGRKAADAHMKFWIEQGDMWHEESVTDVLCQHAAPYVRPIRFNQRQEASIGADWLWWWLDRSGDCFGMLIQAKNLKRDKNKWHIDFNYRSGSQLNNLLKVAGHFQVPAAYMLYCGDVSYRANFPCASHKIPCARCSRAGVSIIDAPSAQKLLAAYPESVAPYAFQFSSPLEDIADPTLGVDWLSFPLGPVLRDFATQNRTGAREVALRIFQKASRTIMFNLAGSPLSAVDAWASYYLQGWRKEVPPYVTDMMDGRPAPTDAGDHLAGIVIVQL